MSTALDRHLDDMERAHNRRTSLSGSPVIARLQHTMELLAEVRDVLVDCEHSDRLPTTHRHALARAALASRKAMQTLRSIAAPAVLDCPAYQSQGLDRLAYARADLRAGGWSHRAAALALRVSPSAVTYTLTGRAANPELLARIEALPHRERRMSPLAPQKSPRR